MARSRIATPTAAAETRCGSNVDVGAGVRRRPLREYQPEATAKPIASSQVPGCAQPLTANMTASTTITSASTTTMLNDCLQYVLRRCYGGGARPRLRWRRARPWRSTDHAARPGLP